MKKKFIKSGKGFNKMLKDFYIFLKFIKKVGGMNLYDGIEIYNFYSKKKE